MFERRHHRQDAKTPSPTLPSPFPQSSPWHMQTGSREGVKVGKDGMNSSCPCIWHYTHCPAPLASTPPCTGVELASRGLCPANVACTFFGSTDSAHDDRRGIARPEKPRARDHHKVLYGRLAMPRVVCQGLSLHVLDTPRQDLPQTFFMWSLPLPPQPTIAVVLGTRPSSNLRHYAREIRRASSSSSSSTSV